MVDLLTIKANGIYCGLIFDYSETEKYFAFEKSIYIKWNRFLNKWNSF